ncbi:hypothetical protein FHS39_001718 [Streptomyces olivoverticillatus]|uniref:NADP-dependent oxidoreductase domain-containing protein n=1 Tax=Streptomyces olivoverticillatus TaxID=66427 RepID=A0A7W7LM69_9ACTN|nr:hypothetical protein [Streptomyces olivoverticillatus]
MVITTRQQWALGGDLNVARVGYGAMKLTGWPKGDRPRRETALAILRRAVELGVNHIDTSHYYSRDGVAANELIREALHPYPDDLVPGCRPDRRTCCSSPAPAHWPTWKRTSLPAR